MEWRQGDLLHRFDLLSGDREAQYLDRWETQAPEDTFRVIATSATRPSVRIVDLGSMDAHITEQGVEMRRSRDAMSIVDEWMGTPDIGRSRRGL